MKLLLFAIFALSSSLWVFSQDPDAKLDVWLSEVFRDCPDYKDLYKEDFSNTIKKRFTLVYDLEMDPSLITSNLSDIALINKCNPEMKRDVELTSIEAINPFKYFFDFYSSQNQIIQVYDSAYYILLLAQ